MEMILASHFLMLRHHDDSAVIDALNHLGADTERELEMIKRTRASEIAVRSDVSLSAAPASALRPNTD
jgi:hypothetical protein